MRSYLYRSALLGVVALLCASCDRLDRRERAEPAEPAAPAETAGAAATPADTLVVDRPTLVAYFAATQAEIDEAPEIGEAMADFQHYLGMARDSMEARGVVVRDLYTDSLLVRHDSATHLFLPREQESGVGYVFYAPGRPPRHFNGVMTDAALIGAADEYLAR